VKRVPVFTVGDKTKIVDVEGRSKQLVAGGVTLNNIVWSCQLGQNGGIFGRLGSDEYGQFLTSEMDRFGIAREHLTVVDGEESPYTDFFVDPQPERTLFMFFGTTAGTTPQFIREKCTEAIRSADYVVTEISQLPLSTVIEIEKIAKEVGTLVAVDLDIAPSNGIMEYIGTTEQYEEVTRKADILKPCDAAATELTGKDDLGEAIEALDRDFGPYRLTAITGGADGSVLSRDGSVHVEPVTPLDSVDLEVVDPGGAGDAYFGGLNAAILRLGIEAPLSDLGTLANATAAVCCSEYGAFPIAPSGPADTIKKLIVRTRDQATADRLID
jgi:sugar/nucleoside kinase (ribokinase family)